MTNLLIRGVLSLQQGLGLPSWVLAAVPFLFIYLPVALCKWRGVDSYGYRLAVPAFRNVKAWAEGMGLGLRWMAILLVPWVAAYHLWQTQLFGLEPDWTRWPSDMATLVLYHIFFVAIPEEFFYRGYVQTRLNEVFHRKFIVWGIPFGHALWIASLIFAFGHSIVILRWWHFAIFFPSLLFALLREKTGGVVAGSFLHAACNVAIVSLDTVYGIVEP